MTDLFLDVLLVAFAALTHRPSTPAPSPCYVVVTAIVSTAHPYTIRRVVTTGIRRYDDSGSGTPSYCTPTGDSQTSFALRAVDARLGDSTGTDNVEHVLVRTTSPDVAGGHLTQIVAKARTTPAGFTRVEVVPVKNARGAEQDSIPMPPLSLDATARAACAADNAALQRAHASFAWAC